MTPNGRAFTSVDISKDQLTDNAAIKSPIRWAGSKRRVLGSLAAVIPRAFNTYIEPFAGSAALFFHLQPSQAILGDLNESLVEFYNCLSTSPKKVAQHLSKLDPTGGDYYRIRDELPRSRSSIVRATRFLYLNRFCFNGVYRTNRAGKFNVPRGTRTGALPSPEQLGMASSLLSRAAVLPTDFELTLSLAESGDFVYIDPPYFTRRGIRPGEYGYDSLDARPDLDRLLDAIEKLSSRGVRYLLSYSESRAIIRRLQPKWKATLRVDRSVGGHSENRKLTREILIANYTPT